MKYLTIIAPGEANWTALTPELHCVGTAKTREDVVRQAAEAIALAREGRPDHVPHVRSLDDIAADVRAELPEGHEVLHLEPAPMNPVSAEIGRAMARAGLHAAELARRLGTSRSAVSRMLDPFYWGHSVELLRRVAQALDTDLRVEFQARAS